MEDLVKWHKCLINLLELGFDLDKNSAKDLLDAILECYENYDEYFNN